MQLSDAIAQYKIDYPYQKIRTKSTPDSISLDDEASCFEQLANLLLPDGIISGMGIAVDGSNNLTVQPGVWQIQRLQYSKSTVTTFALDAQDPTLSRYNVVYADAFNRLFLLSGALSADPVIPAIPDGTLLICTALITPTSVTVNTPPPTDYVDTHSNQTINGVKTFILSPQVPDGVNPHDAVAFEQLAGLLSGAKFNNGIGPTGGGNYGLGGTPLNQSTLLDLSGNTLTFTQGVLFDADFTAYFNANDRALIDAGYFRKNQWYRPWLTGSSYLEGSLVYASGQLFYANNPITNSTVSPYGALRPAQFTSLVSDANNITTWLNWSTLSNTWRSQNEVMLLLELQFTTANNATFPFFSLDTEPFGDQWVSFSIATDNNISNVGYFAEYKFCISQVITDGVWYELMPIYCSHNNITDSIGRIYQLHVDVAKNASGIFEVRGRHKLISGSVHSQDYSLEIHRANSRNWFAMASVSPSQYWQILNDGTNPNTQLPNWKGTDATAIPLARGATVGVSSLIDFAFQTNGLDNYVSDVSGSFTALSKINKAYADATYISTATLTGYLLKAGGTMTGVLNLAADPTVDAQAANKHYVDAAILASAVDFGPSTLTGTGTLLDPFFVNAGNGLTPGTSPYGVVLGGTLAANTTITTAGHNMNFASTAGNIVNFLNGATPVSSANIDGQFYGQGLVNFASGFNSRVATGVKGTTVSRGIADGNTTLTAVNFNYQATGLLFNVQNYYRSTFFVDYKGAIQHATISTAALGSAKGYWMIGGLKASASSDLLMGMLVEPIFGTSTISTFDTLVGGTGYPNGTQFCNFTGGTGFNAVGQVTVVGGVVQFPVTLTDTGMNYSVNDVLAFQIVDSSGSPIGSGGSITVRTITTYTGVVQVAAKFKNAPIVLDTISTPGTFANGMLWQDGTHFYGRLGGASYQLDQQGTGPAIAFGALPGAPAEGWTRAVTNSNTNTWGATITGTGAFHVLAYFNGSVWTVAGK